MAGLGRVAVLDGGARRVVRAIRELARAGQAGAAVVLHRPEARLARQVREADEAVELGPSLEGALSRARADAAWLGPAPLAERLAFAETCARKGVTFVGPPAAVLARLASPEGSAALARELGLAVAPASPAPEARLIEVVVVRDRGGAAAVIGVGEASLAQGRLAVLAECPPAAFGTAEDSQARALGVRAAHAAGAPGVYALRLLLDRSGRLDFAGLDAWAESAAAVEAVTGVDLTRVALQLAAGAGLDLLAPSPAGHAFAAAVLARDPEAPAAPGGRLELVRLRTAPGVHVELRAEEGDEAPEGDAPLALFVAHGPDRAAAASRLEAALSESELLLSGGPTSRAWLLALLARPEVRAGEAGAGLLQRLAAAGEPLVRPRPESALLAAAIEGYDDELDLERARFLAEARRGRPRVGPSSGRAVELRYRGARYRLEVRQTGPESYRVAPAGGAPVDVKVERLSALERRLSWQGRRVRVVSVKEGERRLVEVDGVPHTVFADPGGAVTSPMPAVVVAIPVAPGQRVAAGEPVARIESMKVEVAVLAPRAGVVREVVAAVNGQVDAGAPLLRIEPLGDEAAEAVPVTLSAGAGPLLAEPRQRWLAAIDELTRLVLGFDVGKSEARGLAATLRELAGVAPADLQVAAGEDAALRAFADLHALFGRSRPAGREGPPPLEELWRYLHEPEERGEGLSPEFVAQLRRALAHYGLSLEEPGRALELALLRMQKSHERVEEQLPPVLALLERRLEPPGVAGPAAAGFGSRDLLDRLAEIGQERFPTLADLAGEARYRQFDQPALERARADAYVQSEADLARLHEVSGEERERLVDRLVECTHPLATTLVNRMAAAPPSLRPRLVETLLRRYYRVRPLEPATAREADGVACAWADYALGERRLRVMAAAAPAGEVAQAARSLARLAREVPPERELMVELYLWRDAPPEDAEALAGELLAALQAAGFERPLVRASVVLAFPGRGVGRQASQQHYTFRGGPGGALAEDRRMRGVHHMLAERMQLGRLARFDLERLPSVEDVYLYRGVAQGNPKDERLFAMAEIRDLTPVRGPDGQVRQLPHLERMLLEALAGMRRFQARRAPHQRLEWNRVLLTVGPPLRVSRDVLGRILQRLAPATAGLGLEMILVDARVPDPDSGELRDTLLRVVTVGRDVELRWDEPTDRPLEPMAEYEQKVIQLRRRGLTHPFELAKLLAPAQRSEATGMPAGRFVEYDLDAEGRLAPVDRPPGKNAANVVAGVVTSFTDRYPEGMRRVVLLGDPGKEMGSVAEPECRRIEAAILLAQELEAPLEWFEVCAGAKISMQTGTENMDWVSRVLRRIIEFTQAGGEINVVVLGITVGAQPYWNAEATMLMHTRGILVMAPGSSMVLTGKQALEYSGSVSAEDNEGIGGYDRIMGPNGQAQYRAGSVAEACQILLRHYEHAYRAPGERFPRRAHTDDPVDRDVRASPHGPEGGAGFTTVGDVFSLEKNPDRKKPFDIRRVMAAAADQDHPPLERWRDLRGGETAVVWDAHLGGFPVCLIGIESRPLPRLEFVPADGPEHWSAGTLFPQASKKIARAINAASGNRPLVVLANLSGFDGSPESMRKLQLEYGAEIGRAVVNFRGPVVFCVVSRYHGGAFVVFAKTLREEIEAVAVEGARASVIGGAPAAAVVFAREVESRTRKDPRVVEAEAAAAKGGAARARLAEVVAAVRSEKLGEVGEEFDRIHSVERARKVGSIDAIIAAAELRPWLVAAVERGIARTLRGGR
ncbi:carboxyl transferase domain-containing protein [Anaeromyxobacter paludicola]|uniref:Fused acetyl/propionyl-CoA carboxylase subuit alpha/methylmalonyl-CoA decarboxylase subunit alpha n=1 Tax=Anaeromyxobacter paludicola TaxID=2918171 RepID=A0ABN6NCA3_9BACT|nr:carboxyl transferase domain-containing protein [Anaeromyxobacter paludicola]BDG10879.1 fused acetyl/propionyl-CoA carboxylase subuit alpha/methylmalonyl-CoA decarboxylase subunit alpha [Anaeromyxobacter paludicola]